MSANSRPQLVRFSFVLSLIVTFLLFGSVGQTRSILAQAGKPKDSEPKQKELPLPHNSSANTPPVRQGSSLSTDDIIRRFATKESEFRDARANYTFRQEVRIQTLNYDDRPTGEYLRISEILFTDSGHRSERIVRFPPSTLQGLQITPADLKDLAGIQPFSLTMEDLPKYNVTYIGKERVDEIDTYVFDVRPKTIPKFSRDGDRFFMGRIWVDDQDLQIVKTFGKAVPEDNNNKFPRFQTYRENIDGKYWFPTYTYGVDTLDFPSGSVRMKIEVRYTNYKEFKTDVKIYTDDGKEK